MFYLGTHHPGWLGKTDMPLFVSRRRLAGRKTFPRAVQSWALDSGGFTELSMLGRWTVSPAQYAGEVRRFSEEIGNLRWAAIQDWMCEPWITAKTGLTVRDHQQRTIESYQELLNLAPDLPWVPVLQGWQPADYHRHVDAYRRAGFDLEKLPLVGIGSVCRRQHTGMVEELIEDLCGTGIRLHGFGFKIKGLLRVSHLLTSSDSMAWSMAARMSDPLPGCTHRSCANCILFASKWYERVVRMIERQKQAPKQQVMWR